MASPPAWSMGTGKRGIFAGSNAPGPGSYEPQSKNKQSPPSWKVGTGPRGVDKRNDTPGPGTYNSPGKISTSAPQHGFGLKSPERVQSANPGPGAYDPATLKGYDKSPPSYSFGSRTPMINDKTRVPGPGTYEQGSRIMSQATPGYRLGTAKRDGLYRTSQTPGPGMYGVRPQSAFNKDSGPKFGFGTANRDELNGMSRTLPGPGTYENKGMFESPSKGTTLVPRRPDSAFFGSGRTPGPGAYEPSLSNKKGTPAYRIGSASRDTRERAGPPGPGSYEPESVRGKQNVRIGTSVRSPLTGNRNTPGPGTYDHFQKVGEGPKFIMNPRRDDISAYPTKYVPGPGTYTPNDSLAKEKSGGIRIGTGSRNDLYDTRPNPGPGQYDVRGRLGGPHWGFGSELRGKDNKSGIPGPGTYEHKSRIGDVASYVYGSGPLKIHL